MKKTIKDLQREIRGLKYNLRIENNLHRAAKNDRERYRQFVITHFKNLADCADNSSTPTLSWQLKQVVALLHRVDLFPW